MGERLFEPISEKGSIMDVRRGIAHLLDDGHTVSSIHIRRILISQGLSPKTITEIFGAAGRFEQLTGVPVAKIRYKGINVYYDPRKDLENETDFSIVRGDIDREILLRAAKRKKQDLVNKKLFKIDRPFEETNDAGSQPA